MNIVIFTGNLTAKPAVKTTNGGKQYCIFDIAVNKGKEKQPIYVSVTVWDEKIIPNCERYLDKGSKIGLIGELDYPHAYKSEKTGEAKCNVKVKALSIEFLPKGQRPEQEIPQNIPGQGGGGYQRQYNSAQPDPNLSQQGFSELDPNEQPPWYNGWMP